MKFIKILSKGEIDERAFSLIGASTKKNDDTKIGFFGSGLKYSLAFLLKNQIPFKVFAGYKEIKFGVIDETFRNTIFKKITINGEPTSLTTDMGGNQWGHWSIIRELFSNALDEGDAKITIVSKDDIESLKPVEDFTVFYIQIDDNFKEVIDNWNLYFSEKRSDLLYSDEKGNKIFSGGERTLVYRKSIRCFHSDAKALFHYDLTWVKINESRVISNDWDYRYGLVKFLRPISSPEIVHRIIYNINGFSEKNLDWSWHGDIKFSDVWADIIGDKYLIPYENAGFWEEEIKDLKGKHIILPNLLIESLKLCFGDKIRVIGDDITSSGKGDRKEYELNKRENYLLEQAIDFLKQSEYEIKYPIKVVKFVRNDVLGLAQDETIFVSDKCFSMGTREIINTIIEENEHLKTGFGDETRALQTHLINMVITGFEEKLGRYL